jgi:osmotically-inducible protein OsmY
MRGRTLLIGGLLGAGLAYYLDPGAGGRRRSSLMTMMGSRIGRRAESARQGIQHVGNLAQGTIAPHTADNLDPDDNTLKDRIESQVFRNPAYSREHLNILVVEGVVDLHGQLESQAEIDELVSTIREMRNVRGVQSYLHLPGTPAPNKVESLEVSQ